MMRVAPQPQPPNDAKRLVAMVRGLPVERLRAELLEGLSDAEVIALLNALPRWKFDRLWARVVAQRPLCSGCGRRHWPGDPTCTVPAATQDT